MQNQIREQITQHIVKSLQKGILPWRKPWSDVPDLVHLPTNFTTKRAYQGINIPLLWLAQHEKGFPISYWASFNQWQQVGASVKKGEKATKIVLYKKVEIKTKDDLGKEKLDTFPILRTWSVFNVNQVKGGAVEDLPRPSNARFCGVDRKRFDLTVTATKANIRRGGNKAVYYKPPGDFILMPNEEQFVDFSAYAQTLLHELAHWTEHRVGWEGSYGEGELRAEIASCFSATSLGILNSHHLENTAAYVQSWLKALANDPRFIFRAASAGSKAADYILSFSRQQENNEVNTFQTCPVE